MDFKPLKDGFKEFFYHFDITKEFLELDPKLENLIEKNRKWINWLNNPNFPIAFFGTFSSGKSSLINSIIGRYILPEHTKSRTAIPTVVRKGDNDQAIVHYLSDEGKSNLLRLYIEELEKELNDKKILTEKEINLIDKKNRTIVYDEIREKIKQAKKIDIEVSRDLYDNLKKIFENWDRVTEKDRPISLNEVKEYVTTDAENVLFIDNVEIFIADSQLPKEFILVDLPGLGVSNILHRKLTIEYIEEKAKAFVFCMKPNHLLEGEEIKTLKKIKRESPKVLKRAFWVIGLWDTLKSERQQIEEEANFREKVDRNNFEINNSRFFKVSALRYLLLYLISTGKLELPENSELKKHVKIVESEISTKEDAKKFLDKESFLLFKEELYKYINSNAKREFLNDANYELTQIKSMLKNLLRPIVEQENLAPEQVLASKAYSLTNDTIKRLKLILEEEVKNIRIHKDDIEIWTENENSEISNSISDILNELNIDDIKNEVTKGIDIDYINPRLPFVIEQKLNIPLLIRKKIETNIEENIFENFSLKLLQRLSTEIDYHLPEPVLDKIKNYLHKRDIINRVRGLSDYLFSNYTKRIEEIGNDIIALENRDIPSALEVFREKLIEYIADLGVEINNYSRITIKNYLEHLEIDLISLFDSDECKIFLNTKISSSLNIDEEYNLQRERNDSLNTFYYTVLLNRDRTSKKQFDGMVRKYASKIGFSQEEE